MHIYSPATSVCQLSAVRQSHPAEAATTLALRDGRPEALGFYLDRRRVHIGDLSTAIDAVFNAWQTDRAAGLDAIMLAPTRELVSSLNQRAQEHRLAGARQAGKSSWPMATGPASAT